MRNISKKIMFALILVSLCIVLGASGQIYMKRGMTEIPINNTHDLFSNVRTILLSPHVIIGLLFYGVATFLWLGALSQLEVSYMYPLLSLGYVLTAILACVFIHEEITLLRWVGILLIVVGCFLVIRS